MSEAPPERRRRTRRQDVRFALMMIVALIATYAAWTAKTTADSSSRQSAATADQSRIVTRLAGQNAQLTGEIAALLQRVAGDERRTCQIQAQGLPAGHQLAASMRAIHELLTIRPTAAQRAHAALEPPAVRHALASLNRHLALYLAAEARQPVGRAC